MCGWCFYSLCKIRSDCGILFEERTASTSLASQTSMGFLLTYGSATFYLWCRTVQCPADKIKGSLSLSFVGHLGQWGTQHTSKLQMGDEQERERTESKEEGDS